MKPRSVDADASARLEALGRYRILDTPPEPVFDGIVRLAAQLCEVPIALLTLADRSRQWFKARIGVDFAETPLEGSFCLHSLRQDGLLVVPDARQDPRYADLPPVRGEPGIRFYAGTALRNFEGVALGSLCVMDREPRTLDGPRRESLVLLARQAVLALEIRRLILKSTFDPEADVRLTDEALRRASARFRGVFQSGMTGILFWDADGTILDANDTFLAMLGYAREDLRRGRLNWRGLTPPDWEEADAAALRELATRGVCTPFEKEYLRKDGGRVPVLVGSSAISRDPLSGAAVVLDLTARRRAEEAARQADLLCRQVVEHSTVGIIALDRELRYTLWNPEMERMSGLPASAVLGRRALDLFPVLREQGVAALFERALAGETATAPDILVEHGGRATWTSARIGPLRGAEGKVIGVLGMIRDIGDRKAAELRREEEQTRALHVLERVADGFVALDREWRFTYVNAAAGRMLERRPEDLVGRHVWTEFPEALGGPAHMAYEKAMAEQQPVRFEHVEARTGRCLEVRAYPSPDGLTIFLTDVTGRKQAEEVRARLATVLEHSPDFVGFATPDGRPLYVNAAGRRMVGLAEDGPLPAHLLDLVPPAERARCREEILPAALRDGTWKGEAVLLGPGGAEVPVLQVVMAHRGDGTTPAFLSTIARDIRELKDVEAALRESERRLREALSRVEDRVVVLEEQVRRKTQLERLVGRSPAMQEAYRRIRLAAQSDVTVLLTGESGTGKELAAQAIHALSLRKDRPFIGVNCSAIPESLLESELFGHVKGAFTGAVRDKVGLFQQAEGGTLFLDEVGDMNPTLQLKVLRAIQEREIRRVGDDRVIKVDVRLVTATNRDIEALVASGQVRQDFYYRIRVFAILMPPLRARREDIPLLVAHFVEEFGRELRRPVKGVSAQALRLLQAHAWPGNVRELRNAIEHAFVTMEGDHIRESDLPAELRAGPAPRPVDLSDRLRILDALRKAGGKKEAAARALGISRVTLWKRIRKLGIRPSEYKA